MVVMLGSFLEQQDRLRFQYEDYGKTMIRVTPETSKILGYNMYATIMEPETPARRIQIVNLSSKIVEHLEAAGAPVRQSGFGVAYQLFFQKYRISAAGTVETAVQLPQGIIRTVSNLSYSPELVEIIDDYWLNARSTPPQVQP
jgi:hypothetical protein